MLKNIDIEDIKNIAINASKAIMVIYNSDFSVEYKEDKSPLTKADLEANTIICESLKKLYPNIPIISEELEIPPFEIRKNWDYFFMIDPIDGTKEFIKKSGEWTINIALIYKNSPVLGVVFAPCMGELYYAKKDEGAYLQKLDENYNSLNIQTLPLKKDSNSYIIVASTSHRTNSTNAFIEKLSYLKPIILSKGSSLKLCMVASAKADIYPRLSPTSEWDTAAADAIVRESGSMSYIYEDDFLEKSDSELKPLKYNKENLLNPYFIVR